MKRAFSGYLYNRMEKLGDKDYNHVGCRAENEKFIDFLTQFVPEVGMQVKVKFSIETQGKTKTIEDYKEPRNYHQEYD